MKPYSQDLRERAIAALEAGKTQAEVAAQFSIHKSTLEKWWYRWRDTGSCAALPPAQGPKRTLHAAERFIRVEVKKRPDLTLAELCERVAEAQGLQASPSMMCRELKILNLPLKKVAPRQPTRDAAGKSLAAGLPNAIRGAIGRVDQTLEISR